MPTDWSNATAPSLAVFETLAQTAWNKLPADFRALAGDVVIRVEDFAADDILDELDIEDPYELTGLYQGVSLDRKSLTDTTREPDMVFLYRRAILDEWSDGEEELGDLVAHVLVHEIGHHFGFSDDDMDAIESRVSG
ncbi:metallopeptidase family protein [Hyphomicrobium sp.]|jgi:predicted Zn-dependent protease with MMP-like domain|uniref:metallopeptidase family protein n=1 Tax=Hyphomicrobium sp. TaxID=82 RepID=UPI003569EFFB